MGGTKKIDEALVKTTNKSEILEKHYYDDGRDRPHLEQHRTEEAPDAAAEPDDEPDANPLE